MGLIDTYKISLGYGARDSLFSVKLYIPGSVEIALKSKRTVSGLGTQLFRAITFQSSNFANLGTVGIDAIWNKNYTNMLTGVVHSVTFPAPRPVKKITIPYQGEYIDVPDMKDDYSDIKIKFRNDQSFALRDIFEMWQNMIQKDNFQADSVGAMKTTMEVYWLGNDLQIIKKALCEGVFPLVVGAEQVLEYGKGDITETEVTLSVDKYKFETKDGTSFYNPSPIV